MVDFFESVQLKVGYTTHLHTRLVHHDRLEASLQCRVLLDRLAVFVHCTRWHIISTVGGCTDRL